MRWVKHKALADLFQTGKTGKIDAKMHKRILVRLDRLEVSERPDDMDLPGFDFHALKGFNPTRYTVHVNGPWCIHLNSTPMMLSASISNSTIETA